MKFSKILCVLTGTHQSDEVLSHGIHLAQCYDAELHVLLALDSLPPTAHMVAGSEHYVHTHFTVESQARKWLEDKLATWSTKHPVSGDITLTEPIVNIEEVVKSGNFDLVIKRAADDILDKLFGTADMHLLRACPIPVLLTHDTSPKQYKNIVIAVDANYHYGEAELAARKAINQRLVSHGMQICERENAKCHIVSVFDVYPPALLGDGFICISQNALSEEAEVVKNEQHSVLTELVNSQSRTCEHELHVIQGNPRSELASFADSMDADLVVLGTVARVGIPGLLMGNTAEAVLSQLNCAVLAFKPD